MTIAETVRWKSKPGDTFANVRIKDGMVHIYFPLGDNFVAATPRPAFRLAYLIAKYAFIALFR